MTCSTRAATRLAVQAAAAESDAQLKQRIDRVQADLDQSAAKAAAAVCRPPTVLGRSGRLVKADAAAKMSDVKANIDKRGRRSTPRAPPTTRTGQKPTRPKPSTLQLGGRERAAVDARRHHARAYADKLAKAAANS